MNVEEEVEVDEGLEFVGLGLDVFDDLPDMSKKRAMSVIVRQGEVQQVTETARASTHSNSIIEQERE